MLTLSTLQNTHRAGSKVQRVGRGNGSKRGKTCCRGTKGDKSRSGYKRRYGYEGGQLPMYRRLPCRGFSNGRFKNKIFSLNLCDIERLFNDGDKVTFETLYLKGVVTPKYRGGFKVLSKGELTKKVEIFSQGMSEAAKEKLNKNGIPFTIV